MTSEIPYLPLPLDQSDVRYLRGPDSVVQPGVPAGTVTELAWTRSTAYPGTTRRFRVYVPARYDAAVPASLVVLQDGAGFLDPDDDLRTAVVLDDAPQPGQAPQPAPAPPGGLGSVTEPPVPHSEVPGVLSPAA